MKEYQIKQHPDRQFENKLPDNYLGKNWVISYKTNLFIDGKYVLRFKISLLLRNDKEALPQHSYSMVMKFGFLPPENMDIFYSLANHCYQTAIIEFNKSLDGINAKSMIHFIDASFASIEGLKQMVDNALNPALN